MATIFQDMRFGLRVLLKNPAFTAIAVSTLALGIGANTAVFSIVHALILQPLPYTNPDGLVWVHSANPGEGWDDSNVSLSDYIDWRARNESFEGMAITDGAGFNVTGGEKPERVTGIRASAELLPLLGFDAHHGRRFSEQETRPGATPVTMLSHGFWQRRYGGNPDVVGTTISLDQETHTIIGVLPAALDEAWGRNDLWLPFTLDTTDDNRGSRSYEVVGRLREDVSLEQAQTEMTGIASVLVDAYPESNQGWTVRLETFANEHIGQAAMVAIYSLIGAVAFVLLIACANVANLLIARGTVRHRELAVRSALGAGQWRLVRQLLTECVIMSLCAGAIGILLAMWGLELLVASMPEHVPNLDDMTINGTVLLFTVGISLVAAGVFGLAPAIRAARVNLSESMKEGGRASSADAGRRHGRDLLVIGQIAMALALVICAGLMIRSFLYLNRVDPGFETDRLLTMRVGLPDYKYESTEERWTFYRQAIERVRTQPGIENAAAVSTIPLGNSNSWTSFTPDGYDRVNPDERIYTGFVVVTPGYFQTMEIPVRGREFTEGDTNDAPPVVVVNEHLAERFWPGEDVVGKRLKMGDPEDDSPWLTIVGVCGNILHRGLDSEVRLETYRPEAQAGYSNLTLVVRTAGEPVAATSAVCAGIWAIDPDQPVYRVRTMDEWVFRDIGTWKVYAGLLATLGTMALVLAVVGLYGLMSYTVNQRTQEIGIRMALGARSADVLTLVLRRSVILTTIGVLAGIGMALVFGTLLQSIMFGVSPADPVTYLGVGLLLVAVALLASYVPARRATRVDPMVALRYE